MARSPSSFVFLTRVPALVVLFGLVSCTAILGDGASDGDGVAGGANSGGDGDVLPGGDGDGVFSPSASQAAAQPLRRLTREQYNHAIFDLLGIAADASADFSIDEEGGGYASNYLAPVDPLQVEYYELTADALASEAIEGGLVAQCEGLTTDGPAPSSDPVVSLYQNCNQGGWKVDLAPGVYQTADLVSLGAVDNDASSLTVQPGYEVVLYDENGLTGTSLSFTSDAACLTSTAMNDATSSIEVKSLNAEPDPPAEPSTSLDDCFADFLNSFGRKVYRRPLNEEEKARYRSLFDLARGEDNDVRGGFELVVSTLLQSPHFLYRVELGSPDPVNPGEAPLSQFELASRLSFFLQNTIPDDQLLDAAQAGQLQTVDQVEEQALRLLQSPRARDTIASFHEQWLVMGALEILEKNETIYPEFTPELRDAMAEEVADFAVSVLIEGDGRLETLLTAPHTYAAGPLSDLYGKAPDENGQIAFDAGERGGIFTLASVMAVHSHPDQTSPVVRGYIVSDRLLCILPPPPPPNLEIEIPALDPSLPTRERFELHREDPSCASCHQLMDPLGFTFEHYDGIGRYRTMDGTNAVDATSELLLTDAKGPVDDAVDMMKRLATTDEVRQCMTRQWFRYAFGRPETEDDEGTLYEAYEGFALNDFKVTDLLVALTKTKAFRTLKLDQDI